jgi:sec-independent protein translocase protein TatA
MQYFAIGLGVPELIIILVIVLILFGAGKLPKVMSQLGKGTKAFKDGVKGEAADEEAPAQIDVTPEPDAMAEAEAEAEAEVIAEAVEVDSEARD